MYMRRIIRNVALLLVVVTLFTLSGCSSDKRNFKANYDGELIEFSELMLQAWGIVTDRTYEVEYKDGVYEANINGNIQKIQVVENEPESISYTWVEDVNDADVLKVFKSAKELVIDYIQKSTVLVQKDTLIKEIVEIPIKYTDADLVAEYRNYVVYVNPGYRNDVSEWMIVHELVHFLCEITNGGIYREEYPYELFNEVMTDVIAASMGPEIQDDLMSGYTMYFDFIYAYIGCFKEEAIKAYFYGYDRIFDYVGKDEFDLFVKSFDQVETNEIALVIINNSINKWGCIYG